MVPLGKQMWIDTSAASDDGRESGVLRLRQPSRPRQHSRAVLPQPCLIPHHHKPRRLTPQKKLASRKPSAPWMAATFLSRRRNSMPRTIITTKAGTASYSWQ
ncbi:uncharacterized protein LOC142587471 isoform X2 [Dermacentor variabilis]|uniref:uncharacterized protein LOC142587471 isoform X2 n=1 Tax=Dermacentor variabilis TaxID=34621 RepID=UPI003F5B15A4